MSYRSSFPQCSECSDSEVDTLQCHIEMDKKKDKKSFLSDVNVICSKQACSLLINHVDVDVKSKGFVLKFKCKTC